MAVLTRVRSLLFMPGTRADMIAKIPRFTPDVAAVDLEDAVAPADKDGARATAAAAIDALGTGGPTTILVRGNPVGKPGLAADVAAASRCAAAGLVVPKLSSSQDLHELRQALAENSWTDALVVAGIETALGVADARALLAGGLAGAYFGAEDYIADIGGQRTGAGTEVLYARSQVCLAAYLAGVPAIDEAVVGLGDDDFFSADAQAGRAMGYQGKTCILPRRVELSHRVFTPTPEEVAHAEAVLAAGDAGVGGVDGQMIDSVHLKMAQSVLARRGREPGRDGSRLLAAEKSEPPGRP